MRTRSVGAVAVVVAILVLATGSAFALARPVKWQSTAQLALVPTPTDPADIPSTLDGLNASGTLGTYVELLASPDLKRRAGSPPVALTVRSVPDSRVINLTTVGDEESVQRGLTAIVQAGADAQGSLRDLWSLRTIQEPSAPERAGVATSVLLLASMLLALLAALVVVVALRRLEPATPGPRDPRIPPFEDEEELRMRAVHGSRER